MARRRSSTSRRRPAEPGNYVGPGSCSAVACHGAIRAVAGRTHPPDRIQHVDFAGPPCARRPKCWATPCRSAWVASSASAIRSRPRSAWPAMRSTSRRRCASRNFATEGVSCEACHGPATGWLGYHVTQERHARGKSVKRGMYDTKDAVKRTEKCLTCHLGHLRQVRGSRNDRRPAIRTWSSSSKRSASAMPRHWKENTDADAGQPVRTFAAGQLVHLRASLDRLAAPREGAHLARVRRARLLRLPPQPDAARRQLAAGERLRQSRAAPACRRCRSRGI